MAHKQWQNVAEIILQQGIGINGDIKQNEIRNQVDRHPSIADEQCVEAAFKHAILRQRKFFYAFGMIKTVIRYGTEAAALEIALHMYHLLRHARKEA